MDDGVHERIKLGAKEIPMIRLHVSTQTSACDAFFSASALYFAFCSSFAFGSLLYFSNVAYAALMSRQARSCVSLLLSMVSTAFFRSPAMPRIPSNTALTLRSFSLIRSFNGVRTCSSRLLEKLPWVRDIASASLSSWFQPACTVPLCTPLRKFACWPMAVFFFISSRNDFTSRAVESAYTCSILACSLRKRDMAFISSRPAWEYFSRSSH